MNWKHTLESMDMQPEGLAVVTETVQQLQENREQTPPIEYFEGLIIAAIRQSNNPALSQQALTKAYEATATRQMYDWGARAGKQEALGLPLKEDNPHAALYQHMGKLALKAFGRERIDIASGTDSVSVDLRMRRRSQLEAILNASRLDDTMKTLAYAQYNLEWTAAAIKAKADIHYKQARSPRRVRENFFLEVLQGSLNEDHFLSKQGFAWFAGFYETFSQEFNTFGEATFGSDWNETQYILRQALFLPADHESGVLDARLHVLRLLQEHTVGDARYYLSKIHASPATLLPDPLPTEEQPRQTSAKRFYGEQRVTPIGAIRYCQAILGLQPNTEIEKEAQAWLLNTVVGILPADAHDNTPYEIHHIERFHGQVQQRGTEKKIGAFGIRKYVISQTAEGSGLLIMTKSLRKESVAVMLAMLDIGQLTILASHVPGGRLQVDVQQQIIRQLEAAQPAAPKEGET